MKEVNSVRNAYDIGNEELKRIDAYLPWKKLSLK